MKIAVDRRLFWFLKQGTELDLSDERQLDRYVKQVLTRGRTEDVKTMLGIVGLDNFYRSFHRVKDFLPAEVGRFWEDGIGDSHRNS
jgi:hypothetical protein